MSSKTKAPAWLRSNSGTITVVADGKTYTADKSHRNYDAIFSALKQGNWKKVVKLFDIAACVVRSGRKYAITVKGGQVLANGKPVHHTVAERILQFQSEGLPFKPLVNFLRKLLQNPTGSAVEGLYRFMEANALPVTADGDLLAYKVVDSNYKDYRTHKFDNSVGKTVSIPREGVVVDPHKSCSAGLHIGGLVYVRSGDAGGATEGHVMLVKVNPKDVVSVPFDYNSGKCRCCEYKVMEEYPREEVLKQCEVAQGGVAGENKWEHELEPEDEDESYDPEYDEDAEYPDNAY